MAHPPILDAFTETPEFQGLVARLPENRGTLLRVSGLAGSAGSVLIAGLLESTRTRPLIAVAPSAAEADDLEADLAALSDLPVRVFPQREALSFETDEPHLEIAARRVEALEAFLSGRTRILVTTARAVGERFPLPRELTSLRWEVRVGDSIPMGEFQRRLEAMGYVRVPLVEALGDTSVRGGIVDVFPVTTPDPLRIEFYDERIESIRTFDPFDQRSTAARESAEILPVRFDALADEATPPGKAHPAAPVQRALVELVPESALTIRLWPAREAEDRRKGWAELAHRSEHPEQYEIPPEDVEALLTEQARIEMTEGAGGAAGAGGAGGADAIVFRTRPPAVINRDLRRLAQVIEQADSVGARVWILCDNDGQIQRLEEILEEVRGPRLLERVTLALGPLAGGFVLENARPPLHVFTDHEIFRRARRFVPRRPATATALESIAALRPGDYVVHVDHGIGRFLGLEKVEVAGQALETLVLEYADGEILRVPHYRADLVERWAAQADDGEAPLPRLHRLGGRQWARLRRRVQNSIETLTAELLQLYASRRVATGHAFSRDTRWQREMESAFPYEETRDQIQATEEVKRDMESARPMDRLLVGDAGYGKTEVAIRAGFKAVQDGKQVAVLAPTTVLAEQHLRTFRARLADFPVRVEALSRFRPPSEQRRLLEDLAEGKVDILIGTHRLLSRDVQLKDLGLLVVDDEQRFGVRQKERLKELKRSVDVLAMSATPIPRTLYLSLSGLRDLSLIRTPPRGRHPIITHVLPWYDDLIEDAIRLELDRGGQVFAVHNRVETIDAVARQLRHLVPEARLDIAHGQMPERELERVMGAFVGGEIQVLMTTTIIENGLDVPNANTMIVDRADLFGLAQLYQLRGRVGRSRHRAYCYLIVPENVHPEAEARLRVLEQHSELGAGYRIALRDLELRGAGNLLGREQWGFAQAVGLDLYLRLLGETVRAMKEGDGHRRWEPPEVTMSGAAYLPDDYIPDAGQKLHLYRRISRLSDAEELQELRAEIRDRFGRLPPEAERLLSGAELRLWGARVGAEQISVHESEARINFRPGIIPRLAALQDAFTGRELGVEVRRLQPLSLMIGVPHPESLFPFLVRALELLATQERHLQPAS
ncbi:MAG: transcription-repair coupling factor [Gemmatimonadetes bacterium]|nr:transcription-repair coupling factor [Gemmatimonadota bacterium]